MLSPGTPRGTRPSGTAWSSPTWKPTEAPPSLSGPARGVQAASAFLGVSRRDSVAYGAFVLARRATNRPFRRFPGSRTTRARRSCRAAPSASGTSGEGQRRIDEGTLPFATAMPSPDSDHPYKREWEREDERMLSPAAGTATSCTRATSSSTASGDGKSAPTRPTPTAK